MWNSRMVTSCFSTLQADLWGQAPSSPTWDGPWVIEERAGDYVYKIRQGTKSQRVHVNDLCATTRRRCLATARSSNALTLFDYHLGQVQLIKPGVRRSRTSSETSKQVEKA